MNRHQRKSGSRAKRRKRVLRRRSGVDVDAFFVVETCPGCGEVDAVGIVETCGCCGGPVHMMIVFVEDASA